MTATLPGLNPPPLVTVTTPTGGTIKVMGPDEEHRYRTSLAEYTRGVKYTERSDLEDLERILFMELMVYRWSRWLMEGKEYDGTVIGNETELRRRVQDFGTQITKIKESLKLDRRGRESDAGATFNERWTQLAAHAREFGIMREQQLGRALEIMQALFAAISTFDRSDAEERAKLGFATETDLLDFVRSMRPHFDEVDEYFRTHSQKFWVRHP